MPNAEQCEVEAWWWNGVAEPNPIFLWQIDIKFLTNTHKDGHL